MIKIASKLRDYEVHFTDSLDFLRRLDALPHGRFIIDENVWRLHQDKALAAIDRRRVTVLPIHEEQKNLETVMGLYDSLTASSAKRNMTLIAIGGGIAQDLTGFAASTLYRGVRWAYVPTTLLAQADSCIGGKTSLNFRGFKNLLGTFYPPHEVHINTLFLSTLSKLDYYSGLGEVIKLHLMGGPETTRTLFAEQPGLRRREAAALLRAIRTSLAVKQSFFEDDEFDLGRRNMLNFGHCFGHALESTSAFEIPHGQAVLIGIIFANIVAQGRRLMSPAAAAGLAEKILGSVVTRPKPEQLAPERILEAMRKDKKRTGEGLVLIMMSEDHSMVKVDDLRPEELAAATRDLAKTLGLEAAWH